MKRRVIALLTAVCLAAAPMSVLAEDKEDYSYLEDMSVKELKELRDAINEILGEDEKSDDSNDDAELTNVEKSAVKALEALKDEVADPSALSVNKLYYGHQNIKLGSGATFPNTEVIIIDYTAAGQRKYGVGSLRKESGDSFTYGSFDDVDDDSFDAYISTWSSSPNGLIDFTEFEKDEKEKILDSTD